MPESYVQRSTVVTAVLWAKSVAIALAVWLMAFLHAPVAYVGAMVLTGAISLSSAVVWQMRVYTMRLCALIRATSGLDDSPPNGIDLRSINGAAKRTR